MRKFNNNILIDVSKYEPKQLNRAFSCFFPDDTGFLLDLVIKYLQRTEEDKQHVCNAQYQFFSHSCIALRSTGLYGIGF